MMQYTREGYISRIILNFSMNINYTPSRLKDYALWYYFRYYPSNARLIQKLEEKWEKEDAQKVFSEIKHFLQEDQILQSKIDNYVFRNKNYRYIGQKMREKLFPIEKVEAYLEKYKTSRKSLLSENFLRRKIETFKSKGKSRYYIFQKLWETKEDREVLDTLLSEYFPDGESENILREYEKLKNKYDKQKITQKLISKWFKYDEIKKVLT